MSSWAGTTLAVLAIVATVVSGDVVPTREQLVAAHQRTGETTLQSLPLAQQMRFADLGVLRALIAIARWQGASLAVCGRRCWPGKIVDLQAMQPGHC